MIPAIVLTAGLATRLRPLSLVRAKAALPIGGETIVARILRHLRRAGVADAVLNLHHRPETITSRIGDGSELGLKVRYSWESPVVLGAAGGPRKAAALLDASTVLVVNGDTFIDLDVEALVHAHEDSGALVTLAVVPNRHPEHYSGVRADSDGRFMGIVPRGSTEPSWHLIAFQVVETRIYAGLPLDVPVKSVWPLYHALVERNPNAVRIHPQDLPFIDVGTPDDYVAACRTLAAPDAAFIERGTRLVERGTADVQASIVWDDVTIGNDVRLVRTVVTDGVDVPDGSSWEDVILRRANTPAEPGEQQIGDLLVTPLRPL